MARGPRQGPRAPEVVRDDMHAGDPELIEQRRQVAGVAVHRIAEVLRLAGAAVARHIRRDRPAELARAGQQIAPVIGRAGIAVHENDRLRAARRPRRQHAGPDAADEDLKGRGAQLRPGSIVVVDLGQAGVHGRLERDIMRVPGQAFAPDVFGD